MNIEQFGGRADGTDTTLAVRRALAWVRANGSHRLTFPTGEYHFWPTLAEERYLFVSNNDESLKRLIFVLENLNDFEVDGTGSLFLFHGLLTPFFLHNSSQIRLKDFAVDWERSFHSEAMVEKVADGVVELEIGSPFPYRVEHEKLVFSGEAEGFYGISNGLEFDPVRRETAYQAHDNYALRHGHRAWDLGPGKVAFKAQWSRLPTPGNMVALMTCERFSPAVVIDRCQQTELEQVTLHHSGGMGVIAQCSTDISLRGVKVTPRPGNGRLISLTADATHFSCCAGQITVQDCLFENQLDDAVNVHGIYHQVVNRISPRELEVRLVHPQQLGLDLIGVNDEVDFIDNTSLNAVGSAVVTGVERLNRSLFRLQLNQDLPTEVAADFAVQNLRWTPDVTISGCTAQKNRARGFLLNTGGTVKVTHNRLHTPGAAILIAGDAQYWFESGPVNDVHIAANLFDNCNYGVWGRAAVDINPEIEKHLQATTRYHRNIRIESNTFRAFDDRYVAAQGVEGLVISNNLLEPSQDYPAPAQPGEHFALVGCPDAVAEVPRALISLNGHNNENRRSSGSAHSVEACA